MTKLLASRDKPANAINEASLQSSRPISETGPEVETNFPSTIEFVNAGAYAGSTTVIIGTSPQAFRKHAAIAPAIPPTPACK